jgi:glycosyltransferase involved in cell wall biosynthesis
MARRLKVLLSAYACEPDKGSEPEVGWQWALQMARWHDVTVITRTNNRAGIERVIEVLNGTQPLPKFVYYDRSPFLMELKRRLGSIKLYYLLWQRGAREVVARLQAANHFDLMHHVTFAAFRYPTAIWGHGVATIWGPVGGIESIPTRLLPWDHPTSLFHEIVRNISNAIQSAPYHTLPRRAEASTLILSSTAEMREKFLQLGFKSELMPTIGLPAKAMPFAPRQPRPGPLKLLFVGNLITLKGIDLIIQALKISGTDATLTLVGSGNYREQAERKARRLGLPDRVNFVGRLPREEVLRLYPEYDVFLFPSLHDTGGYAVIEAMLNELPVICLDCGGPAVAVTETCGIKVKVGAKPDVIRDLAQAIRTYDADRGLLQRHARAARDRVVEYYDWDKKGNQMAERYEQAVEKFTGTNQQFIKRPYSGTGGMPNLLHRFFSVRGMLISVIGLLVIGMLGFASLRHLKGEAGRIVKDTLPGLSYAGEANSSLAQAFNRTLLLLMTDDARQREDLRLQIAQFSSQTTAYLEAYKGQIFTLEDQQRYEELMRRRAEYFRVRAATIGLAEQNNRAGVFDHLQRELLPAYQKYKEAGDKLFEYNMREGNSRGLNIMRVCTYTQWIVAGIAIVIFVIGFFIGVAR